jgi:hypothetical protein
VTGHVDRTAQSGPQAGDRSPAHLVVLVDGILTDGRVTQTAAAMARAGGCELTVAALLTPTWLTGLAPIAGVVPVSAEDLGLDLVLRLTRSIDRYGVSWCIHPLVCEPYNELAHLLRRRPARALVTLAECEPGHRRTTRLARRVSRRLGVPVQLCHP